MGSSHDATRGEVVSCFQIKQRIVKIIPRQSVSHETNVTFYSIISDSCQEQVGLPDNLLICWVTKGIVDNILDLKTKVLSQLYPKMFLKCQKWI